MGHENWRRGDDMWGLWGRGGNVQGHRSLNVGQTWKAAPPSSLEHCGVALLPGWSLN